MYLTALAIYLKQILHFLFFKLNFLFFKLNFNIMLKKTAIASVAFGLMVFIGVTAFTPPASEQAGSCPPGWVLKCDTGGVTNNKSKDINEDNCLCRKDLPGKKANGNNKGPVDARNWKDNNQPLHN